MEGENGFLKVVLGPSHTHLGMHTHIHIPTVIIKVKKTPMYKSSLGAAKRLISKTSGGREMGLKLAVM